METEPHDTPSSKLPCDIQIVLSDDGNHSIADSESGVQIEAAMARHQKQCQEMIDQGGIVLIAIVLAGLVMGLSFLVVK